MTRQMGHNAFKIPSKAAVAVQAAFNSQWKAASRAVKRSAIRQALCPAIFNPLKAAISQRMGSIASANCKNNKASPF